MEGRTADSIHNARSAGDASRRGNNDETPLLLRPTTGDPGLVLLLHDFQIDIGDPGDPKFIALTAYLLHSGRQD